MSLRVLLQQKSLFGGLKIPDFEKDIQKKNQTIIAEEESNGKKKNLIHFVLTVWISIKRELRHNSPFK